MVSLFVVFFAALHLSNFAMTLDEKPYRCGPLYITVDSKGFILLNWDFKYCDVRLYPDTIEFYVINDSNKILSDRVSVEGKLRGYHVTEFPFPTPMQNFPYGWNIDEKIAKLGSHCLPYIIESSRQGVTIDSRCMKIYPSWMRNFGQLRIGQMFIPGTHNSGAWSGVPTLMSRYVLNQARNLYEQLVFGQRYFDIRVGVNEDNETRITHNVIQTSCLEEELDNIAAFVKKSKREIIILDVHQFNIPAKFSEKEHIHIIKLIKDKIGKYVITKRFLGDHFYGPTLRSLWNNHRSIIVAYKDPEWVQKVDFLWPAIHRDWGDKDDVNDLKNYVISIGSSEHMGNPMKVLMAEMTPNFKYIVLNPQGSLGLMADEVNRNLTMWIRDYHLCNINLIASDFFLGNRLVDYAIGVNKNILWKTHGVDV